MKNTVPAKGQLPSDKTVSDPLGNGGKKILFLGNSITRHGPAPEIGWTGDWGMAASAPEKDYVHLLMEKIRSADPDAQYMTASLSAWASEYWNDTSFEQIYRKALDYGADVIVIRIGENIHKEHLAHHSLETALGRMLDRFATPSVQFLMTDCFWRNEPVDAVLRQVARDRNIPMVSLGDLGDSGENMAVGRFEHAGVAMHPGDLGMERIADRIFAAFSENIDDFQQDG